MTTEQARKEIVEETLSNRDELRRALMGELDEDVGDGFLDALIMITDVKEQFVYMKNDGFKAGFIGDSLITALEDIAISYANSVNIEE